MDDPDRASPPPPRASPPLRRSSFRRVLAAGFILGGLVWILQGAGILTAGRSFMIGDPTWIVIGAGFVVAGLVVAIRERPGG